MEAHAKPETLVGFNGFKPLDEFSIEVALRNNWASSKSHNQRLPIIRRTGGGIIAYYDEGILIFHEEGIHPVRELFDGRRRYTNSRFASGQIRGEEIYLGVLVEWMKDAESSEWTETARRLDQFPYWFYVPGIHANSQHL